MITAFHNAVLVIGGCALAVCAVSALVYGMRNHIAKLLKLSPVVLVLMGAAGYYAGTKPASKAKLRFSGGIRNDGNSCVSNDTVHISWVRDTSGGIYVPANTRVFIDYRHADDTNGVFVSLAETTVDAWSWTGTVEDATNYWYDIWAYYIPPEPVHTNGVWQYRTSTSRSGQPIPIRARVVVDGKTIATPKGRREDED